MQKVKYDLKESNQTSVQKYRHIYFLRSPIDQELCSKITSPRKTYGDRLKGIRQKRSDIMRKWVLAQSQKRGVSPHEEAAKLKRKVFKK